MDGELLELMLYLSANSALIPTDCPPLEGVEVPDCIRGRCRKEILDCSDSDSSAFSDVSDLRKEFSSFIAASFQFSNVYKQFFKHIQIPSIAKNKNVLI